jgi:membrane protein YqaA with SNARE-associated domain
MPVITFVLGLPAVWQIVIYGIAALAGSFAVYYFGKFITGWVNEFQGSRNATSAGDGRSVSNTSDQGLNDQTDKLPKN